MNLNKNEKFSGKRKKNILSITKDNCAVFSFGCLYVYAILKTTMLYGGNYKYLTLLVLAFGIILIGINILHFKHRYSSNQLLLMSSWLIISVIINIKDYHGTTFDEYMINLVFYIVLGFTLTSTEFDSIANTAYYISIIIIPVIMVLAKIGIIENLVYWRINGMIGNRRESFGFAYPTDFAAHVFYWILLYYYRKRGLLKYKDYLLFIFIALFIEYYCDARLTVASIALLILVAIIYKHLLRRKTISAFWDRLLCWIAPICAVLSWVLLLLYRSGMAIMQFVDLLMSNRLSITNRVLNLYGVKLFGQYFGQHGYGGTTNIVTAGGISYSYVDMSFVRIIMMFGIVFFIILMCLMVRRMKQYVTKNDYLIPVILLVVSISSMVDQHYMDFSYNVFLLTIFISDKKKIRSAMG